jgi:hypothetical protein
MNDPAPTLCLIAASFALETDSSALMSHWRGKVLDWLSPAEECI